MLRAVNGPIIFQLVCVCAEHQYFVLQILTAASHVVTRFYMDPATHAHTSLEVDSYIRSNPWRMKNDTTLKSVTSSESQ